MNDVAPSGANIQANLLELVCEVLDAAVFLTDRNESTLKRVFHEGKRLKLKPENPMMKPFYVDARYAQIQGKVMCVIRKT